MTVYSPSEVEGLTLIRDGLTMAADGVNKLIETTEPRETEKPTLEDISALKYVDKTSDKGHYKTASLTDNPNNPAFLKLQKYLREHNNFAILYGYKLWNFQNSDIIGRRKQ